MLPSPTVAYLSSSSSFTSGTEGGEEEEAFGFGVASSGPHSSSFLGGSGGDSGSGSGSDGSPHSSVTRGLGVGSESEREEWVIWRKWVLLLGCVRERGRERNAVRN